VSNITMYVLFSLLTYFIWCDITFFTDLAVERQELLMSNRTVVVSKFSAKLRMLTHFDQYVYLPLCRWANVNLGISQVPWVTPNLVTFMHFTIAVCCGRFFASSQLLLRRIACIMFEVRSCLDVLDGVVYRAQHNHSTFVSGWGSWGYVIDGAADVFGSLFIIIGTIYRFNKSLPLKDRNPKTIKYKDDKDAESGAKLLSSDESGSETLPGVERHSFKYVLIVCILTTLSVVARSKLWDHFQQTYHHLLGVPTPGVSSRRQLELLNYPSTWMCMWLWRFHSADAFLTFTLVAIFFDKMWKWMRFSMYAALPNLLVIGGLCQLNVLYLKSQLQQ